MKKVEILAPAGSREKLNTAFRFGADACYIAGSKFGLRAYADNFDYEGLASAVSYAHALGKKVYVAVNIFPKNADFPEMAEYLKYLEFIKADGVIMTDAGAIDTCIKIAPKLDVHLSTQANTVNGYTAKFWAEKGVKRIVLARELSIDDVKEIKDILGDLAEIEVFVHGAMCISYSGRCLLSNYLSTRDANRGECVQACRWEYQMTEAHRLGEPLTMQEDGKGTYVLNSKDLNMLAYIDKLIGAGISSFKIEGRMKSEYYVATVVNAYRRAVDGYYLNGGQYELSKELSDELFKTSHRGYTTGFFFGNLDNVCIDTSKPECGYEFTAEVLGYDDERGAIVVEQRNRFAEGEGLEILSPDGNFNKTIHVTEVTNEQGERVPDCKFVQQRLYIKSDIRLSAHDILRRPITEANDEN